MANLRDTSNAFYAGNYRTEARFTLCFYPHEYAMTHLFKLDKQAPEGRCTPLPYLKIPEHLDRRVVSDDRRHPRSSRSSR
jgi:hypothetical protein